MVNELNIKVLFFYACNENFKRCNELLISEFNEE